MTPWSCVLPRSRSRLGLVLVALWSTPFSDSFTSSCPLTPVDSRRLLGLCHPVSHGPDFSLDCRRVLHRIPPNELDQHGPSGHGLRSSQCTEPCECFNVAIPQAMNIVVLGILCSPASNSAVSLFVRSESWGRLMCLFRQTTRHHLLALNHEVVLILRSSLHWVKKNL